MKVDAIQIHNPITFSSGWMQGNKLCLKPCLKMLLPGWLCPSEITSVEIS